MTALIWALIVAWFVAVGVHARRRVREELRRERLRASWGAGLAEVARMATAAGVAFKDMERAFAAMGAVLDGEAARNS